MHISVHLHNSYTIILSEATHISIQSNLTLCHAATFSLYSLTLQPISNCTIHIFTITPTVQFTPSTSYRSHYYFPTDWSLLQGMRPLIIQVLSCTIQTQPFIDRHFGSPKPELISTSTCTNTTVYLSALWISKTGDHLHKSYLARSHTAEPVSFPPPAMSPRLIHDQQARLKKGLSPAPAHGVYPGE